MLFRNRWWIVFVLNTIHSVYINCLYVSNTHKHQSTGSLLYGVLCAQIKSTFHKLNVHAALTPTDIRKHLKPVFTQAKRMQEAITQTVPFVTVSM